MKAIDAAAIVLKDANGPLHSREITERMLERKLWTTEGRTPWDTVRAQLAEDISVAGSASRFVRAGPGVFALSASAAADSLSVTDTAESEQENERSQLDDEADSLSFTDAAERVLKHSTDQQPLHYSEITQRALKTRPDTHRGSHAGGHHVLWDSDRNPAKRGTRRVTPFRPARPRNGVLGCEATRRGGRTY